MEKLTFEICDRVAEAQAILHDHLECGKYTPQEALQKLQAVMSEDGLIYAMWKVGFFPPNNPPFQTFTVG